MGHVEAKVALSNPEAGTRADEIGLVDTGATLTLTVLPRKLADSLRLPIRTRSKAMTAGGPISIDLSDVCVVIEGKTATVRVAISDVVDRLLIGVTTLETLGLIVDPLTSQLKESYYLLYRLTRPVTVHVAGLCVISVSLRSSDFSDRVQLRVFE